jgi:hypothetical protein
MEQYKKDMKQYSVVLDAENVYYWSKLNGL